MTTNKIISDVLFITTRYAIRNAYRLFNAESRLTGLKRLIGGLYLTSKLLKNSICDELWLEMMHRWMHGRVRCKLVSGRIDCLLRNNDKYGLVKFMDLCWKKLAKRESVRLLTSYLVKITRDHRNILPDYISFFKPWNRHMKMKLYRREVRDFPFIGFKPEDVEKAMQISNENGWIYQCLILLEHFCAYYLDATLADQKDVRSAIESGKKLNFRFSVAKLINKMPVKYYSNDWYDKYWLNLYLVPIHIEIENLMDVLHDITHAEARKIQRTLPYKESFIVSFQGSRLIAYRFTRKSRAGNQVNLEGKFEYKGLKSAVICPTAYIYYYYCAIIRNDIESAKRIQSEHDITLPVLLRHAHPFDEYIKYAIDLDRLPHDHPVTEYINYAKDLDIRTIEYLMQTFDIKYCLHSVTRNSERLDKAFPIIQLLTSKGAIVYNHKTWQNLVLRKKPQNEQEFLSLLDVADQSIAADVMYFIFGDIGHREEMITQRAKTLLLLAWKNNSDANLFSTVPIEILQLIFEYLDNVTPMHIKYAHMALNKFKINDFNVSDAALLRSGHIVRFVRDHEQVLNVWKPLHYTRSKAIKRDIKYIEEILLGRVIQPKHRELDPHVKIFKYICKHGKNEQILQHIANGFYKRSIVYTFNTNIHVLERAVVSKNIKLLQFFFKNPANANTKLNKQKFDEITCGKKKQPTISFDEAEALIEEVRRSVNNNQR